MVSAPKANDRATRPSRQMSVADQVSRARELDAIRLQRRLTPREQAEADNLADRAYHRHWRACQREQDAMLAARLASLPPRMTGPRNIGGAKPYEFRGWRAPRSLIGQRIVIHAAAKKIDGEHLTEVFNVLALRDKCDTIARAAAETCLIPEKAIPVLNRAFVGELPMACGIGTAIIGEPRLGTEIAEEFGVPRANDSDRDEHANWGWPMLEIEPWETPIPMRGAQGFWNWPTPDEIMGEQA